MPRRIPDFPDEFAGWNAISSFGSLVSVWSIVLFFYIVITLEGEPHKEAKVK